MILIDYWEELGQDHRMIPSEQHDAWPRTVCWTRYLTSCSCGETYPVISATDIEQRNSPHLSKYIENHRQASHMKHLIQELLETKGDILT